MIETEDRGVVRVLRLQRGKVNALDLELLVALADALGDAERSPARALVLTGAGSSFSAGVDLVRLIDGGEDYARAFLPALEAAFLRLFTFPRPVVAAVNGHAIAGGCILACACDRRLMAAGKGRVGVPELLVGVPFPVLALEILRFAVPRRELQRLVYGGATFQPDEALRMGLVDELVDPHEVEPRALAAAEQLAAIPAEAFRLTKLQLRDPALHAHGRSAASVEKEIERAWRDPATRAVVRAYLERTVGRRG